MKILGLRKKIIYHTVFPSMTRTSARRIFLDGKKKLDRLVGEDLRDFSAVDQDAKRWKYSEKKINELQAWMTSNKYCRDSPNERDTIDKRDLNGAPTLFVVSTTHVPPSSNIVFSYFFVHR